VSQRSADQIRFEDNFSRQANIYARHRPHYPVELYAWLATLTPAHDLAWDCGTGNGQAAIALAEQYDKVVATDASADQISHAFQHPRVIYRVALSEESGLDDHSVDLITVATAVHWFNLDPFFDEVRRVAKPDCIIAVWTLYLCRISDSVDPILTRFNDDILGDYWSEKIQLPRNHYRTLPFPFPEIEAPAFHASAEWTLNDLIGFLESWSAVQKYRQEHGTDPIDLIREELSDAWGDATQPREVRWPLYMRVGRVGEKE
jgi:SAM-dependent methyltransferase